jgi:hypothetical protein
VFRATGKSERSSSAEPPRCRSLKARGRPLGSSRSTPSKVGPKLLFALPQNGQFALYFASAVMHIRERADIRQLDTVVAARQQTFQLEPRMGSHFLAIRIGNRPQNESITNRSVDQATLPSSPVDQNCRPGTRPSDALYDDRLPVLCPKIKLPAPMGGV